MNLRRHVLTAWIALLALLFGVLAPGVSHALMGAAPQPAQSLDFPICSAGHAVSAPDFPGGVDPVDHPFKHCPYCADHHHAPGLPPSVSGGLLAVAAASHPPLFYRAPAPLFHWAAPQSRAPPRLS